MLAIEAPLISQPTVSELAERKSNQREKQCIYCKVLFSHGASNSIACGMCKLIYKCPTCGSLALFHIRRKALSSSEIRAVRKSLAEGKRYFRVCSLRCRGQLRKKFVTGPGNCKACKHHFEKRSIIGTCDSCYSAMRSRALDTSTEKGRKNLNKLLSGHTPESRLQIVKSRVENGWVSYYRTNWLFENSCSEHKAESRQVLNGDSYQCWSCFKSEKTISNHEVAQFHPDQFWQLTYRSNSNTRAGQFAMEQELIERSVGWFAYIKFAEMPDGSIKPLVVGKSGSLAVNHSGSDVSFTYEGDNPGRTFLREENLAWHSEKILIIPCNSEEHAFEAERLLHLKYSLLSS